MAKQGEERTFEATPARLYEAVLRVIAELGYTTLHSDREGRTVSFNTGRSFSTWAGQDLTATAISMGGASAKLVIGGSLATRGNPFGGGSQLVGWGEKGRLVAKVFDAVARVLPDVPEPNEAAASSVDPLERVEKLHQLLAAGALTTEEFEREKAKALGAGDATETA